MSFLELEIARPAFMLIDVFMPVIDGITFCHMARANDATRDIPIIVMSATQQDIPVPIAGFLTKPLDADQDAGAGWLAVSCLGWWLPPYLARAQVDQCRGGLPSRALAVAASVALMV